MHSLIELGDLVRVLITTDLPSFARLLVFVVSKRLRAHALLCACCRKKSTGWRIFINVFPSHILSTTWKVYMDSVFLPLF